MTRFRSNLERECYESLCELFPNTTIEHDYHLGQGLLLDFLIHGPVSIGVEVDGEQHTKFSPRFHASDQDLRDQQLRDRRKAAFCSEQGIVLVRVSKGLLHPQHIGKEIQRALAEYEPPSELTEHEIGRRDYRNHAREMVRRQRKERYRWFKENRKGRP